MCRLRSWRILLLIIIMWCQEFCKRNTYLFNTSSTIVIRYPTKHRTRHTNTAVERLTFPRIDSERRLVNTKNTLLQTNTYIKILLHLHTSAVMEPEVVGGQKSLRIWPSLCWQTRVKLLIERPKFLCGGRRLSEKVWFTLTH